LNQPSAPVIPSTVVTGPTPSPIHEDTIGGEDFKSEIVPLLVTTLK